MRIKNPDNISKKRETEVDKALKISGEGGRVTEEDDVRYSRRQKQDRSREVCYEIRMSSRRQKQEWRGALLKFAVCESLCNNQVGSDGKIHWLTLSKTNIVSPLLSWFWCSLSPSRRSSEKCDKSTTPTTNSTTTTLRKTTWNLAYNLRRNGLLWQYLKAGTIN